MPTIDLGRSDDCCSPCVPCEASDKKEPRISYPCLSISTDEESEMPEGDFEAVVTLHTKGCEWSEDESGKKKCTYRFDVKNITPSKGKKKAKEKEETDAVGSIMESMKSARSKKIAGE